jgi:hypothetical protein
MTRLALLLLLSPLLATGCGGDPSNPMGPEAPAFDQITVSLDEIDIVRDCDGGSGGEFAYMFYVVTEEDGQETQTYLDTTYTSFDATNYTAWDPGLDATFTLPRKSNQSFRVRMRIRELDSTEDFSEGVNIRHTVEGGRPAWTPASGETIDAYTLYDSAQRIGVMDWEFSPRADCQGRMTYTVSVTPVTN